MNSDEQLEFWIQQYAERLTYLAYTYVRDQTLSQDVVQEAFINAYRSIRRLRNPNNPLSWLMKIVINECHNVSRKKGWRQVTFENFPQQQTPSAEDEYFQNSRHQEVHLAILSLPETYRTPIVLFYFEERSVQEIADILNLNSGAVRTRLVRGRNKLYEELKKKGEQNEFGGSYSGDKATIHFR